jgi:hypothetical protein
MTYGIWKVDVRRNLLQGLASIWTGDLTDKGPGWPTGVALAELGLMFGARAPVRVGAGLRAVEVRLRFPKFLCLAAAQWGFLGPALRSEKSSVV